MFFGTGNFRQVDFWVSFISRRPPFEMATRRACREREALPLLNDYIEVLWMLEDEDDEATWCRGQVSEIAEAAVADANEEEYVLATGTLEYVATSRYAAMIHDVEFVKGRLVRRSEPEGEENENPELEWRTPLVMQSAKQHGRLQDEDWDGVDITPTVKRRRNGFAHEHRVKELSETVDRIRKSHAHLLGQVDMLTRKVELNSCRISEGMSSTMDDSVVKVVNFLRHRLEVAVQKSLRKPSKPCEQMSADNDTVETVGGVAQSYLRVVDDCELADFELIARNLYGRTVEDSRLSI